MALPTRKHWDRDKSRTNHKPSAYPYYRRLKQRRKDKMNKKSLKTMRKEDYDYLYEDMDHVDQDKPQVPEIGLDMTRERYQSVTPGQENMEFSPTEYGEDTYSFEVHSDKSGEEVLNKICDQLGVNAATLDPYRVKTFIDSFKEDPQNEPSHNDDQDYDDLDEGDISDENEEPEEIDDMTPGQEDADDMDDAEETDDEAVDSDDEEYEDEELEEAYLYEKMVNKRYLAKNRRYHAPNGSGTKAWRKHNARKYEKEKSNRKLRESYDSDDRYLNKSYSFVLEDTNPWNILHKVTDVLGVNEKFLLPKRKKYFIENCLKFHKQGDPIQVPFLV